VRVTRHRLDREFYRRDPRVVAPELLNKVLVHDERSARLVEVEAYCGSIDPGSHAYKGMTNRNATMFGHPGGLYVYFTYGMHWCGYAWCGSHGKGAAIIIRARRPPTGKNRKPDRRGPAPPRRRDLGRGPAKLGEASGLERTFDGADLVGGDRGVSIVADGTPP